MSSARLQDTRLIDKSTVFLHATNEQFENELKKIPFTTVRKYLGKNFTEGI